MEPGGVVPDVIDAKPIDVANVSYAGKLNVELGNELTPTQVKDEPQITWNADDNALYTLLMVDPDAPSRQEPTYREMLHWHIINIPGNNLTKGQTVAEYRGSGAPQGTGLHRYIFLIFKQPERIKTEQFISKSSRQGRVNFKTRDFISKYNVGTPVAGNFFQAQYDDYVLILKAQTKD